MSATTIIQLGIGAWLFYYITSLQDAKVEDVDLTAKSEPEKPHRRKIIPDYIPVKLEEKYNPFNNIKWNFTNIHPPIFNQVKEPQVDFTTGKALTVPPPPPPYFPMKRFVKM